MECKFPQHHGSDGGGSGIAGALIVLLSAVVGVAIMPFLGLIAHIILIALAAAVAAAVAAVYLTVRRRVQHREVGTSPLAAALTPARPRRQALPEAQEGGTHLHLHGVTPDVLRHVLGQQDGTRWTASIEKD